MTKPVDKLFPPIYPNIEDWPIHKLHEQRESFIKEIDDFTFNRFWGKRSLDELFNVLTQAAYRERIRMKEEPWRVDPPNDRVFWKKISHRLNQFSLSSDKSQYEEEMKALFRQIINRYSEEIVGTFKVKTFKFARKFVPFFFRRLLNAAAGKRFGRVWGSSYRLYEKLRVTGPLESIRKNCKNDILVVLPTHNSNLDSVMVGYAMDSVLGLPSFSYGAGLNLYNFGLAAYYMNRLGAYRVDRRKRNAIYLETLKSMSNLAMQKGTNNLFFPGGTRSRSGEIEQKLKTGLLSTTVEAQRAIFQRGDKQKIVLVPLVLSYHSVLEAKYLIDNYLRKTGRDKYIRTKDQSFSIPKIWKFVWRFFSSSSEIHLSFGKPMDVLGNYVDEDGRSFDAKGKELNLEEFFFSKGETVENLQREQEYTRMLAAKVGERYYSENIVLASQLVAFTAFQLMLRMNPSLDLFGVLRLPPEELEISRDVFCFALAKIQKHLQEMEKQGAILLSEEIELSPEVLLTIGVKKLGPFHAKKPLKFNRKGKVVSDDLNLLFYYHNRLKNYGLENTISAELLQVAAKPS